MALAKKIFQLARRAITASPRELTTRGRQAVFAGHNYIASNRGRSALSSRGHLRSLQMRSDELASWWRERNSRWFVDDQKIDSLQQAADRPATGIPWVLDQADLVVDGKMPLFSYDAIEISGYGSLASRFCPEQDGSAPVPRFGEVSECRFGW